jgi:hypothetical protein
VPRAGRKGYPLRLARNRQVAIAAPNPICMGAPPPTARLPARLDFASVIFCPRWCGGERQRREVPARVGMPVIVPYFTRLIYTGMFVDIVTKEAAVISCAFVNTCTT